MTNNNSWFNVFTDFNHPVGFIFMLTILGLVIWVVVRIAHKDKFHFEVTPAKKCSEGPYMTQSGKDHELCKKMWASKEGRDQIAKYSCLNAQCCGSGLGEGINMGDQWGSGLYLGRPLHFERTPMSNHLWENEICNPPILQKDHPSVL